MSMNRIWNVKNPAQGNDLKVLCVCSAGLLRSPTAAVVLQREFGFNTRSCGLEDYALIPLDDVLLHWAEEIICMDNNQKDRIEDYLGKLNLTNTKVYSLNIEDRFGYMHKGLQERILKAYNERYID